VELKVNDTPGLPPLGTRFRGRVELSLDELERPSRDGRCFTLPWALLVRLDRDRPWPTNGSGLVLLTPRDPRSPSPRGLTLPVHVNVSTVPDTWAPTESTLGLQVAVAALRVRA
jgi:hypothetical protein